jgi:dihydroflavonol-4-reductase
MARVFVTGGNGFMGSRIVHHLVARGYEVVALVGADLDCRNLEDLRVEIRPIDLTDERSVLLALEGGDLLIHNAACYSFWQPDPEHIYRVNVTGTQHVMRAARLHGYRKIVYTSSTATLTPSINRELETEESLFDLRSFQGHYKCSKVIAEMAVMREIASGLPVTIVHPTTVVGRGDRRPTPTGTLIVHFLNGIMLAYADTLLNVVDVDDVAEGHILALERGAPGRQYILGSENLSMSDITVILSELTGIPAPRVRIPPRVLLWAGHAAEWIANHLTHRPPIVDVEAALHALSNRASDSGRAQKELGYAPAPARVALAKAAHWFLEAGMCKERARRRVADHGRLETFLARLEPGA